MLVAGCGGLALTFGGATPDEATVETESAVMVDLPAAEASSHLASEAADGPEQQAAAAAAASPDAAPPKPPEEEKPVERPPTDEAKPAEPVEAPPPPEQQGELAAKPEPPTPPRQATAAPAAAAAAQVEMAPAGSQVPDPSKHEDGQEGLTRPSAHAITLWQQALMKRLGDARRQFSARHDASGTVTVGFIIGERGELISERVAASSGSRALDTIALQLVKRAAPFPPPPAGSHDGDLSFTVLVRFR